MSALLTSPNVLALCSALPQKQVAAGECLMEEGHSDDVLYVLAAGAVEILKGDVQITTVSDPGAVFGEVSILLGIPHMATVKALEPCTVHVAENPIEFLRTHPDLALNVSQLLAKRLHFVTTYLVDLKRQFAGHEDHFGMVDEVLESLVHHQTAASEPGSDRHPDPTVE
jgi:CRP/FNR family transcriptional regulator, cyclic AMP receptor protein